MNIKEWKFNREKNGDLSKFNRMEFQQRIGSISGNHLKFQEEYKKM